MADGLTGYSGLYRTCYEMDCFLLSSLHHSVYVDCSNATLVSHVETRVLASDNDILSLPIKTFDVENLLSSIEIHILQYDHKPCKHIRQPEDSLWKEKIIKRRGLKG